MNYAWALPALLVMSGCGEDDKVCDPPDSIPAVGDWEGCVHRWAYRLAGEKATAPQAGEAIAAACQDAVEASTQVIGPDDGVAVDSMEESGGDQYKRRYAQAVKMATFYTLQARAGHCRKPDT